MMVTSGRYKPVKFVLFFLFLFVLHNDEKKSFFVKADFGDYVDPTFNCPAKTSCKQVCVSTVDDCPLEMRCGINENGTTLQLCPDGTCQVECENEAYYEELKELGEYPCEYDCAPVACAKLHNIYLDDCMKFYGPLYDQETACGELEYAEETHLYTFTEPAFIFCYAWMGAVTVLIIGWSAFNQRLSPVPGSTQELQLEETMTASDSTTTKPTKSDAFVPTKRAWQTGYKIHPLGLLIQFLTIITLFGLHILVIWLTIQYYIQQEGIFNLNGRFDDEVQVLLCFICTWMVGFFWSFGLKWPYSIASLLYRRCILLEATHVAICVHDNSDMKAAEEGVAMQSRIHFDVNYMAGLRQFFAAFYQLVHDIMSFIFSDAKMFGPTRTADQVSGNSGNNVHYQFVKVQKEKHGDGTRFFVFMFRRYNLAINKSDKSSTDGTSETKFVPGMWKFDGKASSYFSFDSLGSDLGGLGGDGKKLKGLNYREVLKRRGVVGLNKIEIKKPTFLNTLRKELAKPFYTYQLFMIWSWFPLWYYYMAMVWLVVVMTGAISAGYFQYRNERSLYQISSVKGDVKVIRDGDTKSIPHEKLVPGDIIVLTDGLVFCDMLLVSMKSNVLVDESALTGEATPIGKTAIDFNATANVEESFYDPSSNRHKRHTIMAGTSIVETDDEDPAIAIVTRTASFTARGELIREIYSYNRHQFKFDVEVPIVLTILFFYAVFGWVIAFHFTGEEFVYGWFYGIYVVATVLPPLLPTVFTVSVGISDDRLTRKRIACTQAESILVAGKVTRAFFDKTGTLTQRGLNFLSATSSGDLKSGKVTEGGEVAEDLNLGMAVCHTLKVSSKLGTLVGNPVDRVMFDATSATLEVDNAKRSSVEKNLIVTDRNGKKVEIVKHFDFDHHRMTQSVIIKTSDGSLMAYVKGSGENVKRLCMTDSLPTNFDSILRESAKAGVYQISMACKPLNVAGDEETFLANITRDEVENSLTFVGVINFKNEIRENSPDVIKQLSEGDIQSYMLTGDSVLTGVCIAKEAGIITAGKQVVIGTVNDDGAIEWMTESDEIAEPPTMASLTSGETQLAVSAGLWNEICRADSEEASRLKEYVRVYGRCTPFDKVSIVLSFVQAGYVTLMCGDGGNDCGALKTAHVGIALSDAEASIVAPFTSLDKTIDSVVEVLKEGRCALASALASYKFILMYGQVETINQLLAAYFLMTFSDWSWVFMDGIWVIALAFSLPLARAAKKLSKTRPTASLLGIQTVSSVFGVLALNFVFTVITLFYLFRQDWYQCRQWANTDVSNILVISDNYEAEVIYLVTGYQYVAAGILYNFGYEFRGNWLSNYVTVFFLIIFTALHFYQALVPGVVSCFFRVNCVNENVSFNTSAEWLPISNDFNTTLMPESFRIGLIIIIVANTLVTVIWEYYVVNGIRQRAAARKRKASRKTTEV